jgi:hypothetical protein
VENADFTSLADASGYWFLILKRPLEDSPVVDSHHLTNPVDADFR